MAQIKQLPVSSADQFSFRMFDSEWKNFAFDLETEAIGIIIEQNAYMGSTLTLKMNLNNRVAKRIIDRYREIEAEGDPTKFLWITNLKNTYQNYILAGFTIEDGAEETKQIATFSFENFVQYTKYRILSLEGLEDEQDEISLIDVERRDAIEYIMKSCGFGELSKDFPKILKDVKGGWKFTTSSTSEANTPEETNLFDANTIYIEAKVITQTASFQILAINDGSSTASRVGSSSAGGNFFGITTGGILDGGTDLPYSSFIGKRKKFVLRRNGNNYDVWFEGQKYTIQNNPSNVKNVFTNVRRFGFNSDYLTGGSDNINQEIFDVRVSSKNLTEQEAEDLSNEPLGEKTILNQLLNQSEAECIWTDLTSLVAPNQGSLFGKYNMTATNTTIISDDAINDKDREARYIPNLNIDFSGIPLDDILTQSFRFKNLHDILEALLNPAEILINVIPNFDTEEWDMFFTIRRDKSVDAPVGERVVFAKETGEIREFKYDLLSQGKFNAILVGGKGEGTDRELLLVKADDQAVGLRRKEHFLAVSQAETTEELFREGVDFLIRSNENSTIQVELQAERILQLFGDKFFLNDLVSIKAIDFEGDEEDTIISDIISGVQIVYEADKIPTAFVQLGKTPIDITEIEVAEEKAQEDLLTQ